MKKTTTIVTLLLLLGCAKINAQNTYSYTGKPRFQIVTKQNNAVLGVINIELFPKIAPRHVRNFDSLVWKGFYDTTAFHRCVPGFVIQGGDPNSRRGPISTWGFGQQNQPTVIAEFSEAKHLRGSFSAARSANFNSATSQFFICVAPAPNLNGLYSLYGRVTSGMSVADAIVNTPKMSTPQYSQMPLQKIEMFVNYIGSNDTIPNPPALIAPADNIVGVDTAGVILKWSSVSDAIIYHLQVSRDAAFSDSVAFIRTPNLTYFLRHLDEITTYYWRVLTNNGGNYSVYSPTWKLNTHNDMTGIVSRDPSTSAIKVFPNPAAGIFLFNGLEKGGLLEVFDPNGKLISTVLINDASYQLNLEGREKGTYIYRLTNSKQEQVHGKLLMR